MAKASSGLPSNLYSGGAVVLDSSPFTNYYLQTQQRKQAQEDALAKYFGNFEKDLTPEGMHIDDIKPLMEKQGEWRDFAIKNKAAIARPSLDGGKAYKEYMGRFNDMKSHIAASKFKVKNLSEVGKLTADPNKSALLPEKALVDIKSASLPVTDPNYKPIDLSSIAYNPKPFGIQEQGQLTALLNRFKGNESVDGTPQQIPGTNQEKVKFKTTFNPDQLSGMYNIGSSLYHNNPSFKKLIDDESDPLSNNYEPLNDVFKSHYGKDIQTPEDMATAHVLSLHPNRSGREQVRNRATNPMDLIAKREQSAKSLIDYRQKNKNAAGQEQGDAVNTFMDQMYETAKKDPRVYLPKTGGQKKQYNIPASQEMKHIFSYKDDKGHPVSPDEIRFSEDGKEITPIYYSGAVTKDGKRAVDEDNSKPVSTEEVKLRLGKSLFGQKANVKAVTAPTSTPKPKSDPLKLF